MSELRTLRIRQQRAVHLHSPLPSIMALLRLQLYHCYIVLYGIRR